MKNRKKYGNGGAITAIANNAKPILDGIMSLLEGTPQYSEQPIVNINTVRNMSSPYSFAMGGNIEEYAYGGEEDEDMNIRKVKRPILLKKGKTIDVTPITPTIPARILKPRSVFSMTPIERRRIGDLATLPAGEREQAFSMLPEDEQIKATSKFIGEIPNKELASGIKTISDVDNSGGLGNVVLNDQEQWLDNWYNVRGKKFGIPFKPKKASKITFSKNEALGEYTPVVQSIDISTKLPGNKTASTYLHEKNHLFQDVIPEIKTQIKGSILNTLKDDYPFGGPNVYSGRPDEIHSRLMQMRYGEGIKPEDVITPEYMKKLTPERRKKYNLNLPDQQLMDLLNKTVSVSKKSTPMIAAMGGQAGDYSEDQLAQLQQKADELGITIEELLEMIENGGEDLPSLGEDEFGLEDDDTALEDIDDEEEPVEEEYSSAEYAFGGRVPIEVEGEEVIETPNGNVKKVLGPKHEQGGVPLNVKKGTNIYSDRLSFDGKTMADRKIAREKRQNKLMSLLETDSHNNLTKNTVDRSIKAIQVEEAKDMAIQKIANKIYGTPGEAGYGDKVGKPLSPFIARPSITEQYNNIMGFDADSYMRRLGKFVPGYFNMSPQPDPDFDENGNVRKPATTTAASTAPQTPITPIGSNVGEIGDYTQGQGLFAPTTLFTPNPSQKEGDYFGGNNWTSIASPDVNSMEYADAASAASTPDNTVVEDEDTYNPLFTTGDYIGMAGNLFNAIAPIINTRNAAKATKPVINRFRGFGNKALRTNMAAQEYADAMRANAITDLATTTNTNVARNRAGARGINTMRALDIASGIEANKAKRGIDSTYSQQMLGLLGQEAQLENMQDQMEMRGQTVADAANDMNTDAYFTSMGQNLTNFGSNISNLGQNLNTSKANQDDLDLLAMLTKNGIRVGRNKKGKWALQNND